MEDNQSGSQNTNNSKVVIGVVIVLVVVIAGYFFFKNGYSAPAVQNNVAPTQEAQTTVTENQVTIQSFSFNPGTITIKVGTTITWANQDDTTHTVTSVGGQQELESGNLSKGQSFTHTFATVGEFNYQCSIHTSMQGKVIVQ